MGRSRTFRFVVSSFVVTGLALLTLPGCVGDALVAATADAGSDSTPDRITPVDSTTKPDTGPTADGGADAGPAPDAGQDDAGQPDAGQPDATADAPLVPDAAPDATPDAVADAAVDAVIDSAPDVTLPASCSDGVKDGTETGVDCGGGVCSPCGVGGACRVNTDCLPGDGCDVNTFTCDANLCNDGIQDGAETDVDCGGNLCPQCTVGQRCLLTADCKPGEGCDKTNKVCDANKCNDGIKDGSETAIDCGGGTCPTCPVGDACGTNSDCTTNDCFQSFCVPVCVRATFGVTGGVVSQPIAAAGKYTVVAAGAQGAAGNVSGSGGLGATVTASFNLAAGATVQVVVGGRPGNAGGSDNGAGGGGSFAWLGATSTPLPAQPLVVAGGGAGGAGSGGSIPSGNGMGGAAGSNGGACGGAGGGGVGWLSAGGSSPNPGCGVTGGFGGQQWAGGAGISTGGNVGGTGGYGGGGGAGVFNSGLSGGGGGYTGGAGGSVGGPWGQGGASYVDGSAIAGSITETAASQSGNGSVTITGPISASCM
jgi:hypothetical protein